MVYLRRTFLKFSGLFANSKVEAELEREIAAHLTLLEDDFLSKGMTPQEARLAARRAYGGVEQAKQLHRNERAYQELTLIVQDIRYTFRRLRKAPGFAASAVLMLTLGIGATTAIFSIVDGVLLRPLPFPDPDRLIVLANILQGANRNVDSAGVTPPDIRNYMRDMRSFTSSGGYQGGVFELSGAGDSAVVNGTRMSGGVFPALKIEPLLGRVFTQQEDDECKQVVVLSYATWQSRFHGDMKIIGTGILLNRKSYLVIGVMPRNFEFPLIQGHLNYSELWVPMSFAPEEFTAGYAASWNLEMVGRLKPGVTAKQAQREADQVAVITMRHYSAFMRSLRIRPVVRSLQEDTVARTRPLVRTLFLAVTVVLLIACANLAGLLLVRAILRRREVAVRLALGAPSATLLRQTILESLVLSMTGGVLGLILAALALRVGINLLPETLPRVHEIGLNWSVVGFAFVLALTTGITCGVAPAAAAIRTNVTDTLKEGGRIGVSGASHAKLHATLVIAEIAVAFVLLTTSCLLLRSFEKMRAVAPGFNPDHTITAFYRLPERGYSTQIAVNTFNDKLLRNLRQLPGIEAAGITSPLPSTRNDTGISLVLEGYVPFKEAGLNMASASLVLGDPIEALGVRLLRGRSFTERDNAGAPLVVIVNHKLAEHYWPGQDIIGKRLRRGMPETPTPWMTVVGEIDDVKMASRDGITSEQIYQPTTQLKPSEGAFASPMELSGNLGYIVLRTTLPLEGIENALPNTVHKIDPKLPLSQIRTMQHVVTESEAPRRFNTILISSFALLAVLLAVLGIYSVIAFSTAMREQEIAIRMALGCQRSGIFKLILISGAKLATIGCALGVLGTIATSSLLRSFLFGVSPFDPAVLTISVIVILSLSLIVSTLPARRAVKTALMQAMRAE